MPVFETTEDDALGLWMTAPQSQTVSFGLGDDSAQASDLFYRVNLPAGEADAERVFGSTEAAIARMESALAEVPERLNGLVQRTNENLQNRSSALSFDVPVESQETGPDALLLAQLAEVDRGVSGQADGQVSFGLGETISDAWGASKVQFDALTTQIDRELLHFAWVDTSIGSQLIARTSVGWSGDAQTVWNDGTRPEQLALHERNLRFVTQTRGLHFRLFITVISGAAKVASLLATPGGALLALPAVYQYVTIILAQARELQSIQTQ